MARTPDQFLRELERARDANPDDALLARQLDAALARSFGTFAAEVSLIVSRNGLSGLIAEQYAATALLRSLSQHVEIRPEHRHTDPSALNPPRRREAYRFTVGTPSPDQAETQVEQILASQASRRASRTRAG